eukprot:TRINITY_DN21121_c0_g1_i10.p1 TRINITY_DN21121_c0_g1~~TRINITY_DN21121_c0_g1_i10.p1  ORF type:complete len:358 (+),score=60.48 TRINITY_DN21121_c0_g1_i10:143-1216(+)
MRATGLLLQRFRGAASPSMQLPVIDTKLLDAPDHLRTACVSGGPGFFYLAMSESERAAADRVLSMSKSFFALDKEKKRQLDNSSDQYFRYGGYRFPASGPGFRAMGADENFQRDTRESYNIGRDTSADSSPPYGATPWPTEQDAPGFKEACSAYADVLCQKSVELRSCLALALDMPRDHFDMQPGLFDRSPWLLGMVHYMPTPSDLGAGKFGIAPHQDDGMFTLLYTDGQPGLQICPAWQGSGVHRDAAMLDASLEWMDVQHMPGHWVVNLGTLLSRWSNGRFKATLHRVVTASASPDRYSLPFFYEANLDAVIDCLPSCHSWKEGLPAPLPAATPGDILLELARQEKLQLLDDEPR